MSDYDEDKYEGEEEATENEEVEAESKMDGDDAGEEGDEEDVPKGEEEGAEEVEEEEKVPEKSLSIDIVKDGISLLCKTGTGLSHAYVKLDLQQKELTDIKMLQTYIHIRYLDVSNNSLKDISPVQQLQHLLTLKADNNLLTSAKLEKGLPYLQRASFTHNKIKTTEGINHPMLESLNLSHNLITKVTDLNPDVLTRLHTLELRGNRLETTKGITLPHLKNLFLAANTIKRLEALEELAQLTTLHIRDNQIEDLSGFSSNNKALQYINLRGNNLTDAKELKKLQPLPFLRALVLAECPMAEGEEYRMEVLVNLVNLERLDKEEYNDEEKETARSLAEQRRIDEEAAAEEAARKSAEQPAPTEAEDGGDDEQGEDAER